MKNLKTTFKLYLPNYLYTLLFIATGLLLITGCPESSTVTGEQDGLCMEGVEAHCEYDVLTFTIAGDDPIEVSINGLKTHDLKGAEKLDADKVEIVNRRGVKFADILARAELGEDLDSLPVNCIARDGWDPLRIRLDGDLSRLPTLSFLREFGYVYVGNPGDQDPLHPNMINKSLMVDYNLTRDDQVPAELGGKISSIGFYRWKMVEKFSDTAKGLFELDPTLDDASPESEQD